HVEQRGCALSRPTRGASMPGKNAGWAYHGDPSSVRVNRAKYQGHVYAAALTNGLTKIGCSADPAGRLAALQSNLRIYGRAAIDRVGVSSGCTNYRAIERHLHEHFAERREAGELFRVTVEDVEAALTLFEFRDDSEAIRKGSARFLGQMQDFV